MTRPPLGDQELQALRFVADAAPVSVGEAAAQFGEPRGLARTTVLTIMERLRRKGYLSRWKEGGVFRYAPQVAPSEALRQKVEEFIHKSLGGNVTPLVAYLAEGQSFTPEELEALRRLAESLPDSPRSEP
jgi:predicted transcriptional regulator